jgi:hypothetical protein
MTNSSPAIRLHFKIRNKNIGVKLNHNMMIEKLYVIFHPTCTL